MSLIITSSAEFDETNQLGIANPKSYRNHIKNPLLIPPNSEVAVDTVKLNRMPVLDYGNSIKTNFWFGERLATNASYDAQTSYFMPADNEIMGSKSPADFATEFKQILQDVYSLHPEINSQAIEVNVALSASNVFEGFQYKIPQVGAAAASVVLPDSCELSEINAVAATYSSGVIQSSAADCFVQLLPQNDEGGPLSLLSGSLTYTGATPAENVIVGLSRPYAFDLKRGAYQGFTADGRIMGSGNNSPFGPTWFKKGLGPSKRIYMDYAVENRGDGIRLYQFTQSNNGVPRMVEIEYYNKNAGANNVNNGPNSSFATGTPIPSASMGEVTFTVDNEKVAVSVSGKVVVEINDFSSASFKNQIPMPTSIANWKMYPTVYFEDNGANVVLGNYACRTNSTIYNNLPENSWITRTKLPAMIERGRKLSQADSAATRERITPVWNDAFNWNQKIYNRAIYKPLLSVGFPVSNVIRNYKGLQSNAIMDDYENIFIMGGNDKYIQREIQSWQANSTKQLGFFPLSINPDSGMLNGAYDGASFASSVTPALTSTQSSFIRVPTLTHETYNFNTGNPSKILFQIPRFDNSGAEVGGLYFQNGDKTFIDLKNAAPIRLTDIDIQIVRKDERLVDDLTGSTEVVLIVRPKK